MNSSQEPCKRANLPPNKNFETNLGLLRLKIETNKLINKDFGLKYLKNLNLKLDILKLKTKTKNKDFVTTSRRFETYTRNFAVCYEE